jgi:hypothetical protein
MAQSCKAYKKWIEERVEQRVDEWVEEKQQKCKKRHWYDPRSWICWLVTALVLVTRWVLVWVGKWITYVVCEVVTFAANFAATFIGLIFSIPILGRFLSWVWSLLLELLWRIVSAIVDGFLGALGIDVTKKLRLCIVILSDARRLPTATPESLQPEIDNATRIYRDAANVKLIVGDIHTIEQPAPASALDPPCGTSLGLADLWLTGTYYKNNSNVQCFDSALLRLIGFRSPVVVFVVHKVHGKKGCSLGPLTDCGLDPLPWTLPVRWIRWQPWDRERAVPSECGDSSRMSSKPARCAWSWTRASGSARSPAIST